MSRWLKITLISTAVIFALLLSTMLIVPWQVKKQGSHWIAENTSRTLTIEKAFFNPFTLTLELDGTTLTEQHSDKSFVTFNQLIVSASIKSIIKQALILDRVELNHPYFNIELLGKQLFNFSDFMQLGGGEADSGTEKSTDAFYFSLNNLVLTDGSIDFTDKTLGEKPQHKIQKLALSIPFIGNIPYLVDKYVEPALSLRLNGSEIQASGKLKPFHDSLETSLYLTLHNIDLAHYAYHSPVPLPVDVSHGLLDCDIDLFYRVSKTRKPQLQISGRLALADLDIRELNGEKLFFLPLLSVDLDRAKLFQNDFSLTSLELREPQLYIDRDSTGEWNFQQLLGEKGEPAEEPDVPAEDEPASELPLLTVEKISLIDGQFHYRDDFVPGHFSEEVRNINLELDHFSTHPEQETVVSLTLQTDRNVTLETGGDFTIVPLTANISVRGDNLPLKAYYPYVEQYLNAPAEGLLSLAGLINYDQDKNIRVQQGELTLRDMRVVFDTKDGFTLSRFSMSGASFDLHQQQINLGALKFDGGEISATRLANGKLSPIRLLRKPPTLTNVSTPEEQEATSPWNIVVSSFDLQQFKLHLTDLRFARKPQVNIADLKIHVEDLNYPVATKSPFSLVAKMGKKGSIAVDGTVIHTPLQVHAQTRISALPLSNFNNFIPEEINAQLKSGKLYSTLTLNLNRTGETVAGDFSGKMNISHFNLRNPIGDGALLTWDGLSLDDIDGKIDPFALHIKEVTLSNYRTNILINSEGRVNLTSLTASSSEEEIKDEAEAKKGAKVVAQETPSTKAPLDIRIDALTLQGGTISFLDRHLPTTFSTTMYKLGGRVTGLASDEQMQADVDLRGQLENNSPLTIQGKINPLSPDLFVDLNFSFKDIDLTPLTPYSGTYLGYAIDKGKLYLDLNYHIEHNKLKASNKVMIDQFTLGETVKSDQATSLPVALAIALLKDSSDEIHLDLPVSGDLDDPHFSTAGVILTVLKNLLVKAAISPFSLLSSAMGDDEDFTSISFASGLAKIDEEQLEKLHSLAEMLAKRPALTLEISGFVDRELDPEGYRQEQFRKMLVAEKWREMDDPTVANLHKEDIVVSDEEYPDILLRVYKDAEFPRPRNFVGMLKTLPVEEMEKLLLSNIQVGEEQLVALAKKRALAVQSALVAADETIKPRLFLKKTDIYQPPEEGPASRVEFSISSK